MKAVPYKDVNITGGFWHDKQKLNSNVTIHAVRDRFADTGRFEAFRFNWKEGMPNKPHIFWDSDVAKWLESAAYIIKKEGSPLLEAQVDEVVDLIAEHQGDDGYFNIYFTVIEPEKRFTNRDCHELYCAGHLMEAAVAYYDATGKDKLLRCMCKYADLIEKVFKDEDSAGFHTPGHEEIELALVKLYKCTGEKRYLDLSKHFIDKRGLVKEVPEDFWTVDRYFQSHKPCREQFTAEGHSVRAGYLYSGMADIAREYSDEELKNACRKLFDDIYYHKMYITAGVGQSNEGEAFTIPYDLQNDRAYAETCASIALVYFAHRLELLDTDSRYGDVIERAIYNGIISGLSLDGKSFFYENPLEINLAEHHRNEGIKNPREHLPITQRLEVFGCSCCPPNLTRLIASVGDYIYKYDDSAVYVDQYISSEALFDGISVTMTSGYPYNGEIEITGKNFGGKKLAVRIPSYSANNYSIKLNGTAYTPESKNGYAFIDTDGDFSVELTLDVSPKKVYGNPCIAHDAGKCAIVAGPLVYCAEGVDNDGNLKLFRVPDKPEFVKTEDSVLGTQDITFAVKKAKPAKDLYVSEVEFEPAELKLIPYFAFANRGESDMAVWLINE